MILGSYDDHQRPMVNATISREGGADRAHTPFLISTGSAVTVLTADIADAIKCPAYASPPATILAAGTPIRAHFHWVNITLQHDDGSLLQRQINAAVPAGPDRATSRVPILGRDMLNHLRLTLSPTHNTVQLDASPDPDHRD